MNTVKITRIEDVQVGDDVTLTRDGLTVAGRVRSEGTAVGSARRWRIYFPGLGTLYGRDGWTLVSATREVPEWEPGTAGTATVCGVESVRVMRLSADQWIAFRASTHDRTRLSSRIHMDQDVTDFLPDDAPRRAAQAKPVEAEKATTFTTPGGTHENDR